MKKNQQKRLILISLILVATGITTYFTLTILNNSSEKNQQEKTEQTSEQLPAIENETESDPEQLPEEEKLSIEKTSLTAGTGNCTASWGRLMLINPNFPVDETFIATRKAELINIEEVYGIREGNYWNGAPLLDSEAAKYLNEMNLAYSAENPGHSLSTLSCFRSVGTNCGRLCVATGGSDHHSGYTCDLYDPAYGGELNTDLYYAHPDWQWLRANSYKFGFIDRFPEAWAGGSMDEPANIDINGTTGLFETWHYRFVGVSEATEIATGKYNNGNYDSLEHYLREKGYISNLLDLRSCNL